MILLFLRDKKQTSELDQIEREAHSVHQENITKIQQTRKKVDKLNMALKQNNIVFQLAHIIGNHE